MAKKPVAEAGRRFGGALLAALAGDDPKTLRKAILDFGSETDENRAAAKAVRRSRGAWRIDGHPLGDIAYEIENLGTDGLFRKVSKRLPGLTADGLDAALRVISLAMIAAGEPSAPVRLGKKGPKMGTAKPAASLEDMAMGEPGDSDDLLGAITEMRARDAEAATRKAVRELPKYGWLPRIFTATETLRLADLGLLGEADELIDGRIVVKGSGAPWRFGFEEHREMAEAGMFGPDEETMLVDGIVMSRPRRRKSGH